MRPAARWPRRCWWQRPVGVIALGRGADRPRFTATDIEVVEELARRLAEGIANADTFAREHAIAETLQRSVLPDPLPQIPGWTSRCVTCPPQKEPTSAATGMTLSPLSAAGSGW